MTSLPNNISEMLSTGDPELINTALFLIDTLELDLISIPWEKIPMKGGHLHIYRDRIDTILTELLLSSVENGTIPLEYFQCPQSKSRYNYIKEASLKLKKANAFDPDFDVTELPLKSEIRPLARGLHNLALRMFKKIRMEQFLNPKGIYSFQAIK